MISTLDSLLGLDELVFRIAERRLTGLLHVYHLRESANLFYKDGTFLAGYAGEQEGEGVLKLALGWPLAFFLWEAQIDPEVWREGTSARIVKRPATASKPKFFSEAESVLKAANEPKPAPPLKAIRNPNLPPPPEPPLIPLANPDPILVPLTPRAIEAPKAALNPRPEGTRSILDTAAQLMSTRTLVKPEMDRLAQDERLLRKHRLALVPEDAAGTRYEITRVSCVVGRNPACDIAINDASISRQHCFLQITDRGLHIKDLGTTNGTRVNGILLTEGYVNAGDKLTIGHVQFQVEKVPVTV